jgi:uroporphyrin-III C-methyltransferase / precorrin-2 dehydrogenase / sirohydrochlorin ferrochelatase
VPTSRSQPYLAGVDLHGRRVLVVGGRTSAGRRLPALLAAGAAVEVVAPEVTPAVEDLAASGRLTWHRRAYGPGDVAGAWLVVVCTSALDLRSRVIRDAERECTFCLDATDPAAGSLWPAQTHAHDDLVVGVWAPPARARRAAVVCSSLVEALAADGMADQVDDPRGGVALVGGGPGDPDLLTVRAARLLARADVVVTDRLAPRDVLDSLGPDVEVIDASKIPYGRAMPQERIHELLVARAREGRFVVRLKGGDPFVYGRGYEEVIACSAAGVPVTVVPGVTSALAAPAAAGIPVSHRRVAHEIVVVSAHVPPDHPDCLVDWAALSRLRGTIVLLMGVRNVGAVAATLMRHGRPRDTPVLVVQDATTRIQREVRTRLDTVASDVVAHEVAPPAVIVIGAVAGLTPDAASWVDAVARHGAAQRGGDVAEVDR